MTWILCFKPCTGFSFRYEMSCPYKHCSFESPGGVMDITLVGACPCPHFQHSHINSLDISTFYEKCVVLGMCAQAVNAFRHASLMMV